MILLIPPSYSSSSSFPNFKSRISNRLNLITTTNPHFTKRNHLKPHRFNSISCSLNLSPSLDSIKPYVQSEWKTIVNGWICSAVSVYSLSRIVPRVGRLSGVTSVGRLRRECVVIGVLFLVRLVSNYFQQSLLWEAALRSVYRIRVCVFERVLQRDLGFFEGGSGKSVGDVAYRITAEASDTADTIYALLNVVVPSSLQLFAMATQMVVISPVLSLASALVISMMAMVSAYFGEELREISNKANLSIAAVSAYLNEVLPAVLFVKANNAEYNECMRFKKLAHDDLYKRLNKKKNEDIGTTNSAINFIRSATCDIYWLIRDYKRFFKCNFIHNFTGSLDRTNSGRQTLPSRSIEGRGRSIEQDKPSLTALEGVAVEGEGESCGGVNGGGASTKRRGGVVVAVEDAGESWPQRREGGGLVVADREGEKGSNLNFEE
ncbi:hypothetical protein E3N88_31879 [Mikania micrantha]|uniref:ABC transmembrane type-1 domain-containing protein n=1 Tax=Mikania micrantha TaxID=192012 RepID=A0A5N6M6X4_9ASTR|nr:hypothetical protein E3N88_31879 [Mikania micrantha]